jgi:hypothetical protein
MEAVRSYETFVPIYKPTVHHIEQVGVAVTLQTRIRKVLGSNIGRDTGYPETFRGFFQFFRTYEGTISFKILSNSLVILQFDAI